MSWPLIAYKYVLSFLKREWVLSDYPVVVRKQTTSPETPAVRPWSARILNWWLVGLGDTPQEAREDLRRNLDARRAQGPLPRPGSRPPIEFAAAEELQRHGDFAYDFIERVVGTRPFFMSDQTSLADFCTPEEAPEVHRKAALLYGVDTREMTDTPLWKVLDLVRRNQGVMS